MAIGIEAQALPREGAGTSRAPAAQGLRPIQIWVPDVRAPSFRSEAHRQSLGRGGERPCARGSGVHRRGIGLGR